MYNLYSMHYNIASHFALYL